MSERRKNNGWQSAMMDKNLNQVTWVGQYSKPVHSLSLKAKLTIRKAYDFKSPECLKTAL
jgi:hypothetical protein